MAASNVLFAARNWMFAAAMGVIYWLVTWAVAEINVARPFDLHETGAVERVVKAYREHTTVGFSCNLASLSAAPQTLLGGSVPRSRAEQCYDRWKDDLLQKAKSTFAEQAAFERSRQVQRTKNAAPIAPTENSESGKGNESVYDLREPVRLRIMAEYALFRANDYPILGADWWRNLLPLVQRTTYMLLAGLAGSPLTAFMVVVLYITFIQIAASRSQGFLGSTLRWGTGTLHFLCHLFAMWSLFGVLVYMNRHFHAQWYFNCLFKEDSWFWSDVTCPESDQLYFWLPTFFWEQLVYPVQMVLLGGLVAGTIFGLYLAAGYIFARTNDDWAFSAQSSPDYRNFLRMKFEPNRLVVYPIGIDRTPRLRSRWAVPGWIIPKDRKPGAPLVEPRTSITPRLIEGPIEIKVSDVENVPRGPRSS